MKKYLEDDFIDYRLKEPECEKVVCFRVETDNSDLGYKEFYGAEGIHGLIKIDASTKKESYYDAKIISWKPLSKEQKKMLLGVAGV
jgi:hypothetical protein